MGISRIEISRLGQFLTKTNDGEGVSYIVTRRWPENFIYLLNYIHLYSFEGLSMVQKNVTLSLDEDTYEKYKDFCKKNAVALSRSIEVFMEEKTKKREK